MLKKTYKQTHHTKTEQINKVCRNNSHGIRTNVMEMSCRLFICYKLFCWTTKTKANWYAIKASGEILIIDPWYRICWNCISRWRDVQKFRRFLKAVTFLIDTPVRSVILDVAFNTDLPVWINTKMDVTISFATLVFLQIVARSFQNNIVSIKLLYDSLYHWVMLYKGVASGTKWELYIRTLTPTARIICSSLRDVNNRFYLHLPSSHWKNLFKSDRVWQIYFRLLDTTGWFMSHELQ